jgi:hypothetical protein
MSRFLLLLILSVASNSYAAKWNKSNNPHYFDAVAKNKIQTFLAKLPLKGELKDDRYGWSETYWPSHLGGIAYRWNHPHPNPFNYKLHSKEELLRMNQDELAELSPAELYDIAMGDYKYRLTRKVLKLYSPKDLWWEGICHGWALAAANYPEPSKRVVINKDGISVPFGSSDVKALISMHDAYNSKGFYVRVGDRCGINGKVPGEESPEDGEVSYPDEQEANRSECQDVNAGAFHVVLSSMIGVNSQSFVADIDRFNDVWNQPVTGFESKIIGQERLTPLDFQNGVTNKFRIKTKMIFGEELEFYTPEKAREGILGFVSKEPVTGTKAQTFEERNYEYILEVDSSGEIVGGEWVSLTRPDMLWLKAKDVKFRNGKLPLAGLNRIYRPIQRNLTFPFSL